MDIFEITGWQTGVSKSGVNFLQPSDSFQNIQNGYINRQVLQSRQGFGFFAPRLAGETRIFGIFEHVLPNGTKELLAIDQNFLYKFNTITSVFDQLAFAGSLAGYAGFGISSKDFYVSGTSYPTATNTARFVFTGRGMTAAPSGNTVFFYNGTDVRDFTSVADNPNYAAPTSGVLNSATYVFWFGERLNFIVPIIAGTAFEQGMLYSGIRNTAGNGDKFNVPGSGLLQLDTYENITGASILGQVMIFNAFRSNWVIEKTRDAFNPYFSRKVPSVIGTNADFSAVSWNDTVHSVGRTGIIGTDNRHSLRVDDKIPNFTAEEFNQEDFNLTYGGFDRINNQYMWAFKDSGTSLSTQNKVLIRNYDESSWSVYDQRFSVFGQTDVGLNLAWNQIDETLGNSSWERWDTTEELWNRIGLGFGEQKTLAGDDLGFIYDVNQDYEDYYTDIVSITQAAQAVLTVDASGFLAGDIVAIENVEGMTEINNYDSETNSFTKDPYVVVSATPTSLTLNVASTLFTAATPNTGNVSKVISFSAQTIPFNPYRDKGLRCYVSHVEFLLDRNGGHLRVDVIADEEESPFIQDVLLLPSTSTTKSREWITMTVDQEANFLTFIMKQDSVSAQVRLTSVRIHCAAGGLTSG